MATRKKPTRRKRISGINSEISYEEFDRMYDKIKTSSEKKFENAIREMITELHRSRYDDQDIFSFIEKLTEYTLEPYGYEN